MTDTDSTYWTAQIAFLRLPNDRQYVLELREFDGRESKTITRTHGFGPLDEDLLDEHLTILEAIAWAVAKRVEGVQPKLQPLA